MTIQMLVFDLRESDKQFFENNELQNFNFTFYDNSLNPQTVKSLPQEIKDRTTVISVSRNSDMTREVIDEFKNLRIISTRSTSYCHISKNAATERNIAVINVKNYGETSAAQFIFAQLLALTRKIIPASRGRNIYENNLRWIGRDLTGMTLGIVGAGPIEASVCKIANGFDLKILGYDPNPKKELTDKYGLEYTHLEDLLKTCDIISLHIPYSGDNFHLMSNKQFELMKPNSYFLSLSNIKLINLESLYNALKNGKLSGAALDATCCEYRNSQCENNGFNDICDNERKYFSEFMKMNNVIITPNIAYSTEEAINYMFQNTIDQIREVIKGGDVYGVF